MADAQGKQHDTKSDAAKLALMRRISLIIDILLIGGCIYLLVDDTVNALHGAPQFTARGVAFLVNLSASFALVYRSMALLQRFRPASPARKWVGVLKWLLVLVVPVFVAFQIERLVHAGHRAQLDALVVDISSRTANAIMTNVRVRVADLDTLQGPYLRELRVRTDTGAFMLRAWVPGLDIDGYAARYSSGERVWHLQPDDSPARTAPVFDTNGPVLVCRSDNQQLNCEDREP